MSKEYKNLASVKVDVRKGSISEETAKLRLRFVSYLEGKTMIPGLNVEMSVADGIMNVYGQVRSIEYQEELKKENLNELEQKIWEFCHIANQNKRRHLTYETHYEA